MNEEASFGLRAASLTDPASLIELEATEGKAGMFADIDTLLARVALRALRAETTVVLERGRPTDSVSIVGLDGRLHAILDDEFSVPKQHSRGAWFFPEKVSLKTGLVNLPSIFAKYPRFATGLASDERARVLLTGSDAVLLWAVVQPLFEQLLLPFDLRGHLTGMKSRDDQLVAWASFDEIISALRLGMDDEIAAMRHGGGWNRLGATEQLAAKQRLLAALAREVNDQTVKFYRAYRLLPLIARYYAKAKNGQARRKQVLTRPLEATLSGFFGGDWLRLLRYLGEVPHPEEKIETALPEATLFAADTRIPSATPAAAGSSADDVGVARVQVEERVKTLNAFWTQFDEAHSRQSPGMRSLWGLVAESRGVRIGWNGPDSYTPELYRSLLPSGLVAEIERLWGSTMLMKWPDRIVDEISPHVLMAETFGIALRFWQGVALTAWFVCEGPISRTDIAGLADYFQDDLAELKRIGCPIDSALFEQLRHAETRLGPPEPLREEKSSVEIAAGFGLEISVSMGSRRSGFEGLRDVITQHRRAWSDRYLESYLQSRWEDEIGEAARHHAEAIAEKGKPPTPKQFAKHALFSVNHWFGGNLSALYAAIGQESAAQPVRVAFMPADRLVFAKSVFENLGGRAFDRQSLVSNQDDRRAQAEEQDRQNKLGWLAEESLRFVQLHEALGSIPEMKDFGASGFQHRSASLSPDPQQAWNKYASVVEATLGAVTRAGEPRPTTSMPTAAPYVSPTPPAGTQFAPQPSGDDQPERTSEPRHWLRRFLGR